MVQRSYGTKTLAIMLCLLAINVTVPFSWSETFEPSPLGAIVTRGTVTVGDNTAPTGTTVFSGDRIATTDPALVNLMSGSRIELTNAAATLSREGDMLVVAANHGLLRFNFLKGEEVRIDAGKYSFTSVGKDSAHVGALGLNTNGQVVLAASEGTFACLNTASGEVAGVFPGGSFDATDQPGQGALTKGDKTLTDATKKWRSDELKGKCLEVQNETHTIAGNTDTVITIKGSWKLNTGSYEYKIKDCNPVAMLLIVAGVAGAVGLGVGVYEVTKSPSSP